MRKTLSPGDLGSIKKNIHIKGELAFRKGERVRIEGISPNPERPEYRYVVFSAFLQKHFELSERELGQPYRIELQNTIICMVFLIVGIVMLLLLEAQPFIILGISIAGVGFVGLITTIVRYLVFKGKEIRTKTGT